jgi:hypothetical protein
MKTNQKERSKKTESRQDQIMQEYPIPKPKYLHYLQACFSTISMCVWILEMPVRKPNKLQRFYSKG